MRLSKRLAAEEAIKLVESGMTLGLGTGTTESHFLDLLGERLRMGQLTRIRAIASSIATETRAKSLGIPLFELDAALMLDLTIDGADEIDPNLELIKGGGGALLREKIVAEASRRLVIIADESKLSSRLGLRHSVPVEVVPFAWRRHESYLRELSGNVSLRTRSTGDAFVTDGGNFIIDCHFSQIDSPLTALIKRHAGIVKHGIFLGYATEVIIGGSGGTRRLTRKA